LYIQENAMDVWDFKKWRKKLGYTQAEAGDRLGYSRAAVQYWEAETPVPLAVELACRELLRRWKQRLDFGPVALLFADDQVWQQASPPCGVLVLRSERHPNNESAIKRAVWLRETMTLVTPLIVEDDGNVVWSGPELLRECDALKESKSGDKTSASFGPIEEDRA
jgi:DNA-binding XRE family transcriptional regulator